MYNEVYSKIPEYTTSHATFPENYLGNDKLPKHSS